MCKRPGMGRAPKPVRRLSPEIRAQDDHVAVSSSYEVTEGRSADAPDWGEATLLSSHAGRSDGSLVGIRITSVQPAPSAGRFKKPVTTLPASRLTVFGEIPDSLGRRRLGSST